jgi:predicted glycogen debranching enzyme
VIEFGRAICGDLAAAERREWLVTNGLGSYASGTVAGTLTRRYHGLLVAAFRPPVERTLLVTKIDENVRYRGVAYALATNRWQNDYISPPGFKRIERFYLDATTPVWEFALADALLEKRIWMEPGANVTYVRYRAIRAAAPLELSLRTFVNYRNFHGSTHAGNWHVTVTADGACRLRVDAVADGRPFWIAADDGVVSIENVWYRDFVLAEEALRGLDDRDDHLAAGSFDVTLAPNAGVTVVAADTRATDGSSVDAFRRRSERERAVLASYEPANDAPEAPAWVRRCVLAADQFIVAHPVADDPHAQSVIAGYHWFGDWGRDTMIALPGLTLTTGRPEIAKNILTTFSRFVDGGMLPNYFPDDGVAPQYNTADAALWYVEAAARYVEATADLATLRAMWPSLQQVIARYRAGTRYGIAMDSDGLIVASAPGVQLTWMDAKIGDWVVTPRMGKPIEIAALWYNALVRMQHFAVKLGDSAAAQYAADAQLTCKGFTRFWSAAAGYCYDVLDSPEGDDASLRPNQLFAVSLPNSPLQPERWQAVVDACASQLLTSLGMRSLAPSDPRFAARYQGSVRDRDAAYHQGTVWPWLLGAFALAHARVHHDVAAARSFLRPLTDSLLDGGLGSVGEIADATEPFPLRGAIAQAWSVAELLRAWHEIPSVARGGSEPAPQ